jgi:Flp pilus assembly pilin Flp
MLSTASLKAYIYVQDLGRRLKSDTRGVTMLEYTILIGLITAGVVGIVQDGGTWVQARWDELAPVFE